MSSTAVPTVADPAVRLDVRPDRVAVLTIDQPTNKANILTRELWTELDATITPLAGRPDLKGLVIASGKKESFIAGADLKMLGAIEPGDAALRQLVELGLSVLAKIERLPFPTCAAIDGAALGGGFELALACDYRVAGSNRKIELGLPEVRFGLIPGWGGTQRLQRVIGTMHAAGLLEDGHSVDAEQAMFGGMVEAIAESANLLDAAAKTVLTRTDWKAVRFHKSGTVPYNPKKTETPYMPSEPIAAREVITVLVRGADLPLHDAIRLETEAFLQLAGSEQSKEKIADFFSGKKKPSDDE